MAALFSLPALRLVLPEDAYKDVPACWWGLDRFIAHGMALYDMHYRLLYLNRMVASIKRETFLKYLRAEAEVADFGTGRNAGSSMARLMRTTGMSESTMHRGRQLLHKLGCRTVVYRGRQLTKLEALDMWSRDQPKITGWTAVAALHESQVLPVDNSLVQTLLEQGFGTPPPRSGGYAASSRREVISTPKNAMKRCAPRSLDKRGQPKQGRSYDPKAVLLASGVRRDPRFPLWVRQIPQKRMEALLTRKARADWDVDDVFGAVDEWRISGMVLLTSPKNPAGYLWKVLDQVPDDEPPARMDRARTAEIDEAARAERARQREEERAAAMNSAGPHSPGRAEFEQFRRRNSAKTAGQAAARAREAEWARRELAVRED
ncbi:hypothetical protein [Nocardia sp. NBC_01388]|uniref:hypothetical protein n=1 Tax=Nocardia sp. NBC_01388 TaxID=2903596 RepID=UPI002F90CAA9